MTIWTIAGGIIIAALALGCGALGLTLLAHPEEGGKNGGVIGSLMTLATIAFLVWLFVFKLGGVTF